MFCPNCGTKNIENALFCCNCGIKLENLQKGKSNLQTGGIGLENLVCEIMQCEGYESKILAKNKFQGKADADILAIKEDSFMSKKIFVQVKHHNG